jgi:spore maturation protein CgeB
MPGSGARKAVVTLVGQRRDLRAQICEALLAQGIPVSAHGVGWASRRYLRFPRFLRTLQESAINLNVGSRHRVYEVTGCGGFLLTTPVEGLAESYVTDEADPANAEVALAHDIEQLVEKIRYYLTHEEEREAIAARGHLRAKAEHTWSHRLAEVCEKTEWTLPGMGS